MCRASTQVYALVRIIECKKKKKEEEEEEEEKKKSTMHIMTRLKCRGKLGRGGLKGGHGWLLTILGVMKCTLCTEHEVTSRNFIVGCPSHKAPNLPQSNPPSRLTLKFQVKEDRV